MNELKKADNLLHAERLNLTFSVIIERVGSGNTYTITRRREDGELIDYGNGWITQTPKGYTLNWVDCFNKIRKTYLPPAEFEFEF